MSSFTIRGIEETLFLLFCEESNKIAPLRLSQLVHDEGHPGSNNLLACLASQRLCGQEIVVIDIHNLQ
jgi:hypothetical protein